MPCPRSAHGKWYSDLCKMAFYPYLDIFHCIAYLMNDTALVFRLRVCRYYGFLDTCKTVRAYDQNALLLKLLNCILFRFLTAFLIWGLWEQLRLKVTALTLFSLSCRALGREVEEKMIEFISDKY